MQKLEHLNPAGIKSYFSREDTIVQWWDPLGGRYRYHFENMLRAVSSFELPLRGARVLDVGTGRGLFSIWFAEQGAQVLAVDISEQMLELARENAQRAGVADRIEFALGDAEELSGIAGGFDVASCMSTFDHIPDLGRATRAMAQRLKPKGAFLFTYCPPWSLHGVLYQAYERIVSRFFRLSPDAGLVAKLLSHRHIEETLRPAALLIEKRLGVGLTCLLLRPEFERPWLGPPWRALSRFEESIVPYYAWPPLVRCGQTVVGLARTAGA